MMLSDNKAVVLGHVQILHQSLPVGAVHLRKELFDQRVGKAALRNFRLLQILDHFHKEKLPDIVKEPCQEDLLGVFFKAEP
jgi:hypothetical protein